MAKKRNKHGNVPYEDYGNFEQDYLKGLFEAMAVDTISLPGPVQQQVASVISQAYDFGRRGTNANVASIPFPNAEQLFPDPSLRPRTIGDAEKLMVRALYPDITAAVTKKAAGRPGIDPGDMISDAVVSAMNAMRTFDPSQARGSSSYTNYISAAIYGTASSVARDAGGAEALASNGTADFWYNQLRRGLGENSIPSPFSTLHGTPLIGASGVLNPTAFITGYGPTGGAPLPGYAPAYIAREDVDRYISAKESGVFMGSQQTVSRVERGLRRMSGNIAPLGQIDSAPAIGSASQEYDAVAFMRQSEGSYDAVDLYEDIPSGGWGSHEINEYMRRLQRNFIENTQWFGAQAAAAKAHFAKFSPVDVLGNVRNRLRDMSLSKQNNGMMPRLVFNPDADFGSDLSMGGGFALISGRDAAPARANRDVFETASMAAEVSIAERDELLMNAADDISFVAGGDAQSLYQLELMEERVARGNRLAPQFSERFNKRHPGMVPASKKAYSMGMKQSENFRNKPYADPSDPELYRDPTATGFTAYPESDEPGPVAEAMARARGAARHTPIEVTQETRDRVAAGVVSGTGNSRGVPEEPPLPEEFASLSRERPVTPPAARQVDAADGVAFGKTSISASDVQEYMDRGMSKEEAVAAALRDGRGATSVPSAGGNGNGSKPPVPPVAEGFVEPTPSPRRNAKKRFNLKPDPDVEWRTDTPGGTGERDFKVPVFKKERHTAENEAMALDRLEKRFPTFTKKYMGMFAKDGDVGALIEDAHVYKQGLPAEENAEFDMLWEFPMARLFGPSELTGVTPDNPTEWQKRSLKIAEKHKAQQAAKQARTKKRFEQHAAKSVSDAGSTPAAQSSSSNSGDAPSRQFSADDWHAQQDAANDLPEDQFRSLWEQEYTDAREDLSWKNGTLYPDPREFSNFGDYYSSVNSRLNGRRTTPQMAGLGSKRGDHFSRWDAREHDDRDTTPDPAYRGRNVNQNDVDRWTERVGRMGKGDLKYLAHGGRVSSKLGEYYTTQRSTELGPGFGQPVAGVMMDPSTGEVTLGEEGTARAVDWLKRGSASAIAGGGLVGSDAVSATATMKARFNQAIDKYAKEYLAQFDGADADLKENARAWIVRVKETAKKLYDATLGDDVPSSIGGYGANDFQYNSMRLGSAKSITKRMESDSQFKQYIEETFGTAEAAAKGPQTVKAIGHDSYTFGEGVYGDETSVRGRADGTPKSPYQSDFGRAMMAGYMGQLAWGYTGGTVTKAADRYGMSQYDLVSLAAFGGGDVTGAPAYASQKALAEHWGGSMAYQAYGPFLNPGFAFGGGAIGNGVTQISQAAMMGAGAGVATGMGVYAAGAGMGSGAIAGAAGAVGTGVAGAVGIPLLAMAGYNAFTGQTPAQGMSPTNTLRAIALQSSLMASDPTYSLEQTSALASNPLNAMGVLFAEGTEIDKLLAEKFPGMSEREVYKKFNSKTNELFPGLFSSIAPANKAAASASVLAEELSLDSGIKYDDILKQLQPMQYMLGGLAGDNQKDLAKRIFDLTQTSGIDQSSVLKQMAGSRGLTAGSDEYLKFIDSYLNLGSEDERTKFTLSEQHAQQGFGMFAPYLQGTTYDASKLYDSLGMNLPKAQSFAAVASAAANAQGSELTTAQQWNLGLMSNQLGKYSTTVSGMASQLDFMGVMDFQSAFQKLGGNVANGSDVQVMQAMLSGNKYAWSDFGRQTGTGVYQTLDAQGWQAGVRNIDGLMQFARQGLVKGEGVSRWGNDRILRELGVSDAGYRQALDEGGLWAVEDKHIAEEKGFRARGFELQSRQIDASASYATQMFGFQTQQAGIQWQSQLFGFDMSQRQMDTSNRHFLENWLASQQQSRTSNQYNNWQTQFNYETGLMQRGFARENFNFQQQMTSLQQGWGMEDINEQIRRSSGYERAMLIRQRGRMVTSNQLQNNHAEEQQENQEELWKREDERYQKTLEYQKQMQQMDEDRFERQKRQHDETAKLEQEALDERIRTARELHEIEVQQRAAQREYDLLQTQFARDNLQLQKDQVREQAAYAETVKAITRLQQEQATQWQKIASYAPAFKSSLDAWMNFMRDVSTNVPAQAVPEFHIGGR